MRPAAIREAEGRADAAAGITNRDRWGLDAAYRTGHHQQRREDHEAAEAAQQRAEAHRANGWEICAAPGCQQAMRQPAEERCAYHRPTGKGQ